MQTDNFVTVLTFTYPYEVAVIRGRLESEGIPCFVQDELTVQIQPFYSNAIGGVKLQVRESDLEQTMEILKDAGYLKDPDVQPPKASPVLHKTKSKNTCPFCGSENVAPSKKGGWWFLIFSLIFLFPVPFFKKTHYCFDCEQEF